MGESVASTGSKNSLRRSRSPLICETSDRLRFTIVKNLEIVFRKIANRTALGVADHDGNKHLIYVGFDGSGRSRRDCLLRMLCLHRNRNDETQAKDENTSCNRD